MKGLLSGLIALLLTFGGGYWYGGHVEKKAQQAEVDRLNTQARAKEAALAAAVNTTADALRRTNEKAKTAAQERDAAITAGTYRMRVPVQTACPVPAAADSSTPAGDNRGEARAELDPAFGKALFELTEEGDRAIRRLNACISLYNKAIESQKEIK
jgi:D-serine deaminase-like pyridoxal phosphate-dependent protein